MGDQSTGKLSAAAIVAEAQPTEVAAQTPDAAVGTTPRGSGVVAARLAGWVFFIGGLVGAVLGIAGLHVEIAVAGLILSATAGLILLRLRDLRSGRF